jgi:hypothetical protein
LICQAAPQTSGCKVPVFTKPPMFAGRGRTYSSEETPMENPTKEQIIHRAYELWEQAGKPEGRDQEFYHQAEKELKGAQAAPKETPEGV